MATAATEIVDRESFEEWLRRRRALLSEQQFRQEVVVLASRCALRVLPGILGRQSDYYDNEEYRPALEALRAAAISSVAAQSIDHEIELAATAAFENMVDEVGVYSANMHAGVASVYDPVVATGYVAFCAVHAVTGLIEYQDNADYLDAAVVVSNDDSVYEALSRDAQSLEQGRKIAKEKLWQREPVWWLQAHDNFRKRLQLSILAAYGYDVWSKWYEAIATGQDLFDIKNSDIRAALERSIALGSVEGTFDEKFWTREEQEINADLKRWVKDAQTTDRVRIAASSIENTVHLTETSFDSRTASIETTVRENRVALLDTPLGNALAAEDISALMGDIAKGLRALGQDTLQTDRAIADFLRATAAQVDFAIHEKASLFESGRGFEALQKLAPTVDAEWSALLAAQYHALMLQFSRALNKFSAWRDAMREHRTPLAAVDVNQVVQVVDDIAGELEGFEDLVAPNIVSKLRQLAGAFRQGAAQLSAAAEFNAQLEEAAQRNVELFVEDMAYSLANVLTSATQIIWSYTVKPFADGVREQLPVSSKLLGKRLVRWVMTPGAALLALEAAFPGLLATIKTALAGAMQYLV
jgi:hypothetical protein